MKRTFLLILLSVCLFAMSSCLESAPLTDSTSALPPFPSMPVRAFEKDRLYWKTLWKYSSYEGRWADSRYLDIAAKVWANEPIDDDEWYGVEAEYELVDDPLQRSKWLKITFVGGEDGNDYKDVYYYNLVKNSFDLTYCEYADVINEDGERCVTQTIADFPTQQGDGITLQIRQSAYDASGNELCGVSHVRRYEWVTPEWDPGYLYEGGYYELCENISRFDDGYTIDYGLLGTSYPLGGRPDSPYAYEPVLVWDLPPEALSRIAQLEPRVPKVSYYENAGISFPTLVDQAAKQYGAHRVGEMVTDLTPYRDFDDESNIVLGEVFTLFLNGQECEVFWLRVPRNTADLSQNMYLCARDGEKNTLLFSTQDDWDGYIIIYPTPVQSPDGQTAWVIREVQDGKRGIVTVYWHNIMTGNTDIEYTASCPDGYDDAYYSFDAVSSIDEDYALPSDGMLTIRGCLTGFDESVRYGEGKEIYRCDYMTRFRYDPAVKSLIPYDRFIKSSEGFEYHEEF